VSEQAEGPAGPIGGQALLEGVMMRCGSSWGAAVRRDDGTIVTTRRSLSPTLDRWRAVPLVRGVLALAESVVLGTRAMLWAAAERTDEEDDGYSPLGLAVSVVLAAVLAVGVFGLLPAAAVKAAGVEGTLSFNLIETVLRLSILVGYLWLLSRSNQVRRVFGYHGAEHMTIHAFEHRMPLEPDAVRHHDRRHPRCGTSFLLLVVVTTMAVHVLVGTPGWAALLASRVALLPVVAGLSYEVVRFAGRHQEDWFGRVLMAPGYWLQQLSTRRPDDDQIEVAIAALEATLTPAGLVPGVPADRR
jgi:uncharacterized protein YqhQ